MPRASARESQPQPQPRSQLPARGKQGVRGKKRVPDEEDEPVEDAEHEQGGDEEMESDTSEHGDNGVERKANDLVRLALFTEYRRTPLRRDEIAKKVLGGRATKHDFQPVFERAQRTLHTTFGMQLFEIMSRAERDRADAVREGAAAQNGESNVTGLKKRGATASSKQYILRSTLDPAVIEAASAWDMDIEAAERAENAALYPSAPDRRTEGTIIAWKHASADQLGATGVLHVILALILVNGRVLTDMQLRTYLRRMRLPMGAAIPAHSASASAKPLTIDAYLAQLLRQSYLDKQKTSLASAQAGTQKHARGGGAAAGGDEDGDVSFEWRWGTRAIAEVGEEGVGAFVVDFMDHIERAREGMRADAEGEGARGGGKKAREQPVEKRKEVIATAIGRAAGGGLVAFK